MVQLSLTVEEAAMLGEVLTSYLSDLRMEIADTEAMERLKAGDWGGFGAALDTLRRLLEELSRPPSGD